VLDHVERRRFLVEPTGEDPLELALRIADVELDEGAGQLLLLPGRGRLASAQANDHVADAECLTGLHRQIAFDAVALVQQADHRHALGHGRGAGRRSDLRLRNVNGHRLGLGLLLLRRRHGRTVAGGKQQQCHGGHRKAGRSGAHQSGVQAW
jgi:hypothetical protein